MLKRNDTPEAKNTSRVLKNFFSRRSSVDYSRLPLDTIVIHDGLRFHFSHYRDGAVHLFNNGASSRTGDETFAAFDIYERGYSSKLSTWQPTTIHYGHKMPVAASQLVRVWLRKNTGRSNNLLGLAGAFEWMWTKVKKDDQIVLYKLVV